MIDPSPYKVVMVVFSMQECSACEEYLPRLRRMAHRYRGSVPILHFDAAAPHHQAVADRYGVRFTPTTLLLRRPTGQIRADWPLSDHQLAELFAVAERWNREVYR